MNRLFKLVDLAYAMIDKPNSNYKHFTFITKRTKIYAIGWNDVAASALKINGKYFEYPLGGIHAESAAIRKLDDLNICRKATLVNIRLNKHKQIRNSKPCKHCMHLIQTLGFSRIYHSTNDGFVKLHV